MNDSARFPNLVRHPARPAYSYAGSAVIPPPGQHAPVVYYLASEHGGVVKIGTTVHMRRRFDLLMRKQPALRPVILATEPGSYDVEQQRHRQFNAARLQGEWFWLTPGIWSHIERLAS